MKETERITELFEDLYDGSTWLGVTLIETLESISAETAAKKISPQWNTVWEIVNHIISWRENVLQRVQGMITQSPADNYFVPVKDQSQQAWADTLQALKASQQQWVRFLQKIPLEDLEKVYKNNDASYYKNIHGIIHHDAYHLGQIVMLAKTT